MKRTIRALLLLCGLIPASAAAQSWPNQPLHWIVPFAAGSGTDVVSRMLTPYVSDRLGVPVIIDNKPGGASIIGTAAVANAAPDGYTIGLVSDSQSINAAFGRKLPYDSIKDFTSIIPLYRIPLVMVASPKIPVRNLKELVAYAKAHPGQLSFGTLGPGSPHELMMESFKAMAGIDVVMVPYRGAGLGVQDLLAGQIQLMFVGQQLAQQHIASGKMIGIGVSGSKRLKLAPDIPTIAEQGYPDYVSLVWFGMLGPANMPRDIVMRLNREINEAVRNVAAAKHYEEVSGAESAGGTPEEMANGIVDDVEKYRKVIKAGNLKSPGD